MRLLLDRPSRVPDWSPDDRSFAIEGHGGETAVISLLDLESGAVTELTPGEMSDWSSDSSRLVFVSNRRGSLDLYVRNGGGANVQQLTSSPERETVPSWSPDGKTILCVIFQEY